MTLANNEELALLRNTARQWIAEQAPVKPDHRRDPTRTRQHWRAMAEMGWPGVTVAEELGGVGMGFAGMGVLLFEVGRELVDVPLLASGLLAVCALKGQPAQAPLLASLAHGDDVATVALDEGAHHAPEDVRTTAVSDGDGWRLNGTKRYVLYAEEADHLIVSARLDTSYGGDVALFVVERAACGLLPLDTLDGRGCAHVTLEGVHVPATARLEGGAAAVDRLASWGRLGMATELCGAAERMLEITVDYLKTREQFGHRIGSFQALQHRAAQLLVAVEVARSAVDEAWAAADQPGEARACSLAIQALVAKYAAGEAAHLASNEIVQMHGGIGMTVEHVAGRYLKWTRTSEQHFGSAGALADRYATLRGF